MKRLMMVGALVALMGAAVAEEVNLALKKPVTASGVEVQGRMKPEEAVDGSMGSRWSSARFKEGETQWIVVDLEKSEKLTGAILYWQEACAEEYTLDVRTSESEAWKTVAVEKKGMGGGARYVFEEPVSARYFRVNGLKPGRWGTMSLFEIAVFNGKVPKLPLDDRVNRWFYSQRFPINLNKKVQPGEKVSIPDLPEDLAYRFIGSSLTPVVSPEGVYHGIGLKGLGAGIELCAELYDPEEPDFKTWRYYKVSFGAGPSGAEPVAPALRLFIYNGRGDFVRPETLRVQVPEGAEYAARAALLKEDFETLFGVGSIALVKPDAAAEVQWMKIEDPTLAAEGYRISVDKKRIAFECVAPEGFYWAGRTLLQLFEAAPDRRTVRNGDGIDQPLFRSRGFMLDVGRKFVPLSYLKELVRIMSYYKMNTLHLHLNDNGFRSTAEGQKWDYIYSAFRMECESFPNLAAPDGHYKKAEFRAFVKDAALRGVTIIPEFDAPAHALAFTRAVPALTRNDGMYAPDHIDITNACVRPFFEKLYGEYLEGPDPVFAGPYVDVGMDEFCGDQSAARDFGSFLFDLIRKHGKTPGAWASGRYVEGDNPISSKGGVYLSEWNTSQPVMKQLRAGFNMVSVLERQVYIVPGGGYYPDYRYGKDIYRRWSPQYVSNMTLPVGHPQLLGGKFAIWNDGVGNGMSTDDLHDRIMACLPAFAHQLWAADVSNNIGIEGFENICAKLSEAPGVNVADRVAVDANDVALARYVEGKAFTRGTTERSGVKAIGWNQKGGWTVSFDLKPKGKPAENATLFCDGTTCVKLSQGSSGKLGFTRDGYDYTFDVALPEGAWSKVVFRGDAKGTELEVNGQKVAWSGKFIASDHMSKPPKYNAMHFPLETIGGFDGEMKNLTVKIGR